MENPPLKREPNGRVHVDLTALDLTADDAGPGFDLERAREFYRDHADEVIARMRNPTTPTHNLAAVIVVACETSGRLRAEAERAVDAARSAREARRALDTALAMYAPRARPDSSRV